MAPSFLRDKPICVKLVKVVENNYYEAGRFTIDLAGETDQTLQIVSRGGSRPCGQVSVSVEKELLARRGRDFGGSTMLEEGVSGVEAG